MTTYGVVVHYQGRITRTVLDAREPAQGHLWAILSAVERLTGEYVSTADLADEPASLMLSGVERRVPTYARGEGIPRTLRTGRGLAHAVAFRVRKNESPEPHQCDGCRRWH